MNNYDIDTPIEDDIDSFTADRKRVRTLIDSIGGNSTRKKDNILNVSFLISIVGLFIVEVATNLLPPLLSLEIGILLVSIKIVWMIHTQSRFQHFNFWVLNAIEHKLNKIDEQMRTLHTDKKNTPEDTDTK